MALHRKCQYCIWILWHGETMIATLLYGIYTLTRYLSNRLSESNLIPVALVNGNKVWNGNVLQTCNYLESYIIVADQCLGPNSEPMGQNVGLMDRAPSEEDGSSLPIQAYPDTVLHEKYVNLPILNEGELQNAVEDEKFSTQEQKDRVEAPMPDNVKINMQDFGDVRKETVEPAETTSPMKNLENFSADEKMLQAVCQNQEQAPSLDMPVIPAHASFALKERWDEYVVADTDEMHDDAGCKLDLVSLLGQNQPQTGWHFPVGPGLTDVEHCPLLQPPPLSYYPLLQLPMPIEVSWRLWETVEETRFMHHKAMFDFTVMSYNILAQDLLEANQELYSHCPPEVLVWNYRCHHLRDEIMKWAPDILCLQEVQEDHYSEQLRPALSQMGYVCVYKRRTGIKTDGCVTCYRGDRFSEVSARLVELRRPETGLLDWDNVAVVLLLQPLVIQGSEVKVKGPPLCVANTHLLFNPRRGNVKLAQLAIVLAEIDSMVKFFRSNGRRCNVVLCGDFNATPHMPLYQFITTGELYYQGLPAWMISGQEDMSYKTHHYKLRSPLWPSSLRITDNCQFFPTKGSDRCHPETGTLHYSHGFLLQMRFCEAACVRPRELVLIPGVTDNTPDATLSDLTYDESFRPTICHGLNLHSVYSHILQASGQSEVTTLHSEGCATVDYIFYDPQCNLLSQQPVTGKQQLVGGLKLIGRLSLLSEADLWSMRGLPNEIFPSDHLSLLAKFQMHLQPM